MNARHTSVIIELALLDNKRNRERPAMRERMKNITWLQFAQRFCSIHISLGRSAGHSRHARRLWQQGATLVMSSSLDVGVLQRVRRTPDCGPITTAQRWAKGRFCWEMEDHPLLPDSRSHLIVFDWATEILQRATEDADIWWPVLGSNAHTYLFLG